MERWIWIGYGTAAAGIILGWILLLSARLRHQGRPIDGITRGHLFKGLVEISWIVLTISLAMRWWSTGHPPIFGKFENSLVAAWVMVGLTWLGLRRSGSLQWMGLITLALASLALIYGVFSPMETRPTITHEKTVWAYFHAIFGWGSYGSYTGACAASASWLINGIGRERDQDRAIEEWLFRLLCVGFLCQSALMGSGFYWNLTLFGEIWQWDPIQTVTSISWLIYGIIIHLRLFYGWGGRRLAWLTIAGLTGLLAAFWWVPLMDNTYHTLDIPM